MSSDQILTPLSFQDDVLMERQKASRLLENPFQVNSNSSVFSALNKWSKVRKRRTDGLDAGKGVRLKRLLDKLAVG